MRFVSATLALPFALSVGLVRADLTLLEPKEGDTVSQLWPEVKAFLDLPRTVRASHAQNLSATEKSAFKAHRGAKPVEFAWTGAADGVYTLKVVRKDDGRVFHSSTVTGLTASVCGRLEIGREWVWTVSDGVSTATGSFFTEDRAPRIVRFDRVGNARDLGGWRTTDGRRVRQGLAFRTAGLNDNAKSEYYTYDEILDLFKAGKLEGAGVGKGASGLSRDYAAKIGRGNGIDPNFIRLIKTPPAGPGEIRLTASDRDYLLNDLKVRSDLDLRGDWETFGMLFSPIDRNVNWFHYETVRGYAGIVSPIGRGCQALNFSVFANKANYPIVFHCIGGTDRTGTLAFLLNALLGVGEEDLIRDYEMSFIASGGVDARHYAWLTGLVNAVNGLPGETLVDKVCGYYLSLGFSREDLDAFRARMLEL